MSPHDSPSPHASDSLPGADVRARPSPGTAITNALNHSRGGFAEERAAAILSALTAAGYVLTDTAAIERAAEVLKQLRGLSSVLDHIIDDVGIVPERTTFSFAFVHADGRREQVTTIVLSELLANAAAAIAAAEAPPSSPQPATEGPAS